MKKKIIVTGAGGFLGGRAAKHLVHVFPEYEVVATARRADRRGELTDAGCSFRQGDLTSAEFCEALCDGAEIIVHCAALSSPFGPYENFHQSNVVATTQLIKAAQKNNGKRFIFISTPSVYFNFENRFDVKESDPLPRKMVNHYAETKLIAEKLVLSENQTSFSTLALRPRAIIGAGDTVIFPRVLEAYQKGKLKIVGDGHNVCDLTCVRNVLEAIVCAIRAPQEAFGHAYNITDGDPQKFWDVIRYTFTKLDLATPTRKVPYGIAMTAATIIESLAYLFRSKKEPALTRYGVGIMAGSFTLNIQKARELLSYTPVQKTLEGIDEFIKWKQEKTVV